MNINIALHTIIYIMVFLFPGVIARRSFLTGPFKYKSDNSNSFERIVWSMIFSVTILFVFSLFMNYLSDLNASANLIKFHLSFEKILGNFRLLHENKFPEIFDNKDNLKELAFVFIGLFGFSAAFGYILRHVTLILRLDRSLIFLKFLNKWEHATISNKRNNSQHKNTDFYTTKVDIKTTEGELFTGRYHDAILDKDGNLYAITMFETYIFKILDPNNDKETIKKIRLKFKSDPNNYKLHVSDSLRFCYKKRVQGDIFTIFQKNIENISITYLSISNFFEKNKKKVSVVINLLTLTSFVVCIGNIFWDFNILSFSTASKRIAFSLTFLFSFLMILTKVGYYFEGEKNDDQLSLLQFIILQFIFIILFLFYLDILNISITSIITFVLFVLLIGIAKPNKDKSGKDKKEETS